MSAASWCSVLKLLTCFALQNIFFGLRKVANGCSVLKLLTCFASCWHALLQNIFFDLRKVANHPLLVRARFSDELVVFFLVPKLHVSSYYYMCPHTTICVLIPLLVRARFPDAQVVVCVLILLYTCPRTTIYMSSYYYIRALILIYNIHR